MHMCSCLTLCDPMDCSLPGSSVQGIFQARTTEWVAISFSRGSSWPRDWTSLPSLLHWQDDSLRMHSLGSYKKCVYQCECECVCVFLYWVNQKFCLGFLSDVTEKPKGSYFLANPIYRATKVKNGCLVIHSEPYSITMRLCPRLLIPPQVGPGEPTLWCAIRRLKRSIPIRRLKLSIPPPDFWGEERGLRLNQWHWQTVQSIMTM